MASPGKGNVFLYTYTELCSSEFHRYISIIKFKLNFLIRLIVQRMRVRCNKNQKEKIRRRIIEK
jgi:hypothetical protein